MTTDEEMILLLVTKVENQFLDVLQDVERRAREIGAPPWFTSRVGIHAAASLLGKLFEVSAACDDLGRGRCERILDALVLHLASTTPPEPEARTH
jgi:hypothetical protein